MIGLVHGILAPKDRNYWQFEKAREYARESGIDSAKEWFSASKNSKLPDGMPSNPAQTYENEGWLGWGDWLGMVELQIRNIGITKQPECSFMTLVSRTKTNGIPIANLAINLGKYQLPYEECIKIKAGKGWVIGLVRKQLLVKPENI